jgi:hypothetical protein
VPLRALLNNSPVISTLLTDDEWAAAKAAVRGDRQALVMPGCGLPGRPWTSPRGLRYFRHQPDASRACTNHEAESQEHLEAKLAVAAAVTAAGWQALIEEPGPGWEADVLAVREQVRIAFEVQWSQQTLERYQERQAAYRFAGVHGVWFARHRLMAAPTRELPVFGLARVEDDGAVRHVVTVQGRDLSLDEAVAGLLGGRIRFASRLAKRGRKPERVVSAYVWECWKCAKDMTIWHVEDAPVEGECGLLEETFGAWDMWEGSDRPENAVDVRRAAAGLQRQHGLAPLAQMKHRRTRPVPEGYTAFCCPSCGMVQGDFDLRNWLMGRSYEPPDGSTALVTDGPDAVADEPHWCFGSEQGHCPR